MFYKINKNFYFANINNRPPATCFSTNLFLNECPGEKCGGGRPPSLAPPLPPPCRRHWWYSYHVSLLFKTVAFFFSYFFAPQSSQTASMMGFKNKFNTARKIHLYKSVAKTYCFIFLVLSL